MRDESNAAIHARNNHRPALLQRNDTTLDDVARAQPMRTLRCKQNISSANGNLHAASGRRVAKRHFDLAGALAQAKAHYAVCFTQIEHRSAKEVLESRRLRQ